jgi:hypothetical protein
MTNISVAKSPLRLSNSILDQIAVNEVRFYADRPVAARKETVLP